MRGRQLTAAGPRADTKTRWGRSTESHHLSADSAEITRCRSPSRTSLGYIKYALTRDDGSSKLMSPVHEISGVVPTEIIDSLLHAVGVDREEGLVKSLYNGGFEVVRAAVKKVGREGWSAGQVLEQVSSYWLVTAKAT
jgi:hypothetical protein